MRLTFATPIGIGIGNAVVDFRYVLHPIALLLKALALVPPATLANSLCVLLDLDKDRGGNGPSPGPWAVLQR